jgi:hypothetical protein
MDANALADDEAEGLGDGDGLANTLVVGRAVKEENAE